MWNSKVVILDEPTAALGVAQTKQVLDLVARLGEQGLAVILISHNLHDIFQVADGDHGAAARPERRRVQAQGDQPAGGRRGDHRRPALQGARPAGGADMSAVAAPPPAPSSDAPAPNTVGAYAQRWWTDVKSGELGSLPIFVGLIIIAIVFQTQNDRFLTAVELRQPDRPDGALRGDRHGRHVRAAARRDRPLDRLRLRRRRRADRDPAHARRQRAADRRRCSRSCSAPASRSARCTA